MTNPYEAPQNDDAADVSSVKTSRRPGLLLFAIFWPLIVILIRAVMLRCLPLLPASFRPAINLIYLPVLFGYAACIVAAVRDSGTISKRVLRGAVALLVMLFCGHTWWIILTAAFPGVW